MRVCADQFYQYCCRRRRRRTAATAATTFASISFLLEQHVLRMRLSPQRVFVDTPSKRSSTTLCPGLAEIILVQFQILNLFKIEIRLQKDGLIWSTQKIKQTTIGAHFF